MSDRYDDELNRSGTSSTSTERPMLLISTPAMRTSPSAGSDPWRQLRCPARLASASGAVLMHMSRMPIARSARRTVRQQLPIPRACLTTGARTPEPIAPCLGPLQAG